MLVDELELEAWLREAGVPSKTPAMRPGGNKPPRWIYNRIPARTEAYAVHSTRPRLKVISADELRSREEVAA
jgi:hypothetical protein